MKPSPWRRIGLHRWADVPDPNPETRGLEQQGYRACLRCTRVKDINVYLPSSWRLHWPDRHD